MFYTAELLSLRRKSTLARCWLAATFSEKMFMKTCKPALIKKINVTLICEEIISTIEIRDGRNYGRFSLYLSSQLMYGVTKILFYQTKFFQDYLFEINWKLFDINSHEANFNAVTLEIPEVPSINEVFRNFETSSNLHLITEEPYTSAMEHLMQDEMNFGMLPNHEMEKFILPEAEELSLNEIRKFRWEESIEKPDELLQVPLVDFNGYEIEISEAEKQTRPESIREIQRESFVVTEDRHGEKSASKKRSLTSPTETPTKRTKVSAAEELLPVFPVEPPPTLTSEPITFPELPPELQLRVTENLELIRVTKPLRRKKFFDKQTKLSDTTMRKYIENVTAHTMEQRRFTFILPPAKEYLRQPATKVFNIPWGKSLTKLYSQYLVKFLMVRNEFPTLLDFEVEDTTVGEIIRADNTSKLRDQRGELSSKIVIAANETTDPSKTLEKIFPTEDIEVEKSKEQEKNTKEPKELIVELPEITGFGEKTGEEILMLERSDIRKLKSTSKSSSSCSKVSLTKRGLLALIKLSWTETRLIKFHELISPKNYNKIDAACAFQYCLEFEAEEVVVLKQAVPFDTIWIEKYPVYESKSRGAE